MLDFNNLPAQDKIYYKDNSVVIYCADCREVLPQFADKSFDLALTDFPYGNNTNYENYEDSESNLQKLVGGVMPELLRLSHRTLVTCGVANISLYPKPTWILSWVTPAGNGSGKWGFCCWQPILAYGADPYLQNGLGRRADTIIKIELSRIDGHPCSKPIDFWQLLMQRGSCLPNDIILDTFGGSGTTAIAARKLGRKCILIEMSEVYCKIAKDRLNQSVMSFDVETPEDVKTETML